MKVRVLDSSYIVDFPANGFDTTKILAEIEKDAHAIARQINDNKLEGWEVCFRFTYNYLNQILIYTRGKSEPKEKYKEITVHIPIPVKNQVTWGVNPEQYVYASPNHLDHLLKNFHRLPVNYSRFEKCEDYVIDCMKRVLAYCFEQGFTLNGIVVKQTAKL
ncbi:Imm9 family immunity protein [Foetidibacter luteolus]|uniref:Imm9 family immunity protein n=1 Tax=Foetidibacter luteolus TaxID=2608880 RepID=UPI00129B6A63|nr:Imm9 family immunity protein [Foetidibacter luteolus]